MVSRESSRESRSRILVTYTHIRAPRFGAVIPASGSIYPAAETRPTSPRSRYRHTMPAQRRRSIIEMTRSLDPAGRVALAFGVAIGASGIAFGVYTAFGLRPPEIVARPTRV